MFTFKGRGGGGGVKLVYSRVKKRRVKLLFVKSYVLLADCLNCLMKTSRFCGCFYP